MNNKRYDFGIFDNHCFGLWFCWDEDFTVSAAKTFYYSDNRIIKERISSMSYDEDGYFIHILKAFEITLSIPRE